MIFARFAPAQCRYPDLKNLISRQLCERAVAILYPQRLNLGRGGPHESAIGATGPGTVGTSELVIITERVDDVALLIGHMVKMGFVEVLDRHIPRHWQQRELSWGWTAVIWLAYILTKGDHRKVSVEAYIQGMQHTLSHLRWAGHHPLGFQ